MYFVYRISARSIIASFSELTDAINYSEQILHLTETEYQILKQVL